MPFMAFSNLVGGVLGYESTQQTNAMQMQLAQQQMAFQKDLATNAMQYRVADLQKAHLNPALAYSLGGAQAMPGAQAQLQNPGPGIQQAASAVGQAAQYAANVRATNASAAKTEAETPGNVVVLKPDGTPDWSNPQNTGGVLGNLAMARGTLDLKNLDLTSQQIQQDVLYRRSQTTGQDVQNALSGLNFGIANTLARWTIDQAIANSRIAQAGVDPAEAYAKLMSGSAGPWIKGFETIGVPVLNLVIKALGTFTPLGRGASAIGAFRPQFGRPPNFPSGAQVPTLQPVNP